MIKDLIKLANHLDNKGHTKEADFLDNVIRKISQMEMGSGAPMSAEEEGKNLSRLTFSTVTSEDEAHILKDIDFQNSIQKNSVPKGSYDINNGGYVVYPHNYPDVKIKFYYYQPGKVYRQFSGIEQSKLDNEISDYLKQNGYLKRNLPVPFSTGITPSSELFGEGPTEREKALMNEIRKSQNREFYEFADPRYNMLVNPEVNMPPGYMLTEDR